MIDLAALNDPIVAIGVFDDRDVRLGFGPAWPTPNGFWMPVYVAGRAVRWRAVCASGKTINGAIPKPMDLAPPVGLTLSIEI